MNLKTFILLTTYLTLEIYTYNDDMLANINYYDKNGKIHSIDMPYLVNPRKIQYGVKFGILIYYLKTQDCKILVDEDMVEHFAAYFDIPITCSPLDMIKDAITHGADFVFPNVKSLEDYDSILTNTYDVPILPIDLTYDNDIFNFVEMDYERRYINIEFIMVI